MGYTDKRRRGMYSRNRRSAAPSSADSDSFCTIFLLEPQVCLCESGRVKRWRSSFYNTWNNQTDLSAHRPRLNTTRIVLTMVKRGARCLSLACSVTASCVKCTHRLHTQTHMHTNKPAIFWAIFIHTILQWDWPSRPCSWKICFQNHEFSVSQWCHSSHHTGTWMQDILDIIWTNK